MDKLCALLILASQATCMNIRHKRQIENNANLFIDKNGWNRSQDGNRPEWIPIQNGYRIQYPLDNNYNFIAFIFPNQVQFPNQTPLPGQGQTSTPSTGGTSLQTIEKCAENCISTPEYNPVCGSDNKTYKNQGRLFCAQNCGVKVTLARQAPCPPSSK